MESWILILSIYSGFSVNYLEKHGTVERLVHVGHVGGHIHMPTHEIQHHELEWRLLRGIQWRAMSGLLPLQYLIYHHLQCFLSGHLQACVERVSAVMAIPLHAECIGSVLDLPSITGVWFYFILSSLNSGDLQESDMSSCNINTVAVAVAEQIFSSSARAPLSLSRLDFCNLELDLPTIAATQWPPFVWIRGPHVHVVHVCIPSSHDHYDYIWCAPHEQVSLTLWSKPRELSAHKFSN